MVCVRGVRPACKAGIDGRAALYRVLLGFNQERAAALADDKAVAVRVKRTAGVLVDHRCGAKAPWPARDRTQR